MTNPSVWVPLVIAFVTWSGAWAAFIVRLMWRFRGKWDDASSQLNQMSRQLRDLNNRAAQIEKRLQQHLDWHIRSGRTGQGR